MLPRKFYLALVLLYGVGASSTRIMDEGDYSDFKRPKDDIEERGREARDNAARNEREMLEWANKAVTEVKSEMNEVLHTFNTTAIYKDMHEVKNKLHLALVESKDMAHLARTQEARVDKLDAELKRVQFENQELRTTMAELKNYIHKINKEIRMIHMEELQRDGKNDVNEAAPTHKIRHNKMIHTQISRLSKTQDQLDAMQQGLQTQLLDVQRRLDRFEEPNWYLLSTKVEFLELQTKNLREGLKNTSQKADDLDRIHASMLELREEVENIENKADATVPELRKEISKIDVNMAQMHAQVSYVKDDQENLRQSVKAIAVSVSNAVDKAEADRSTIARIDDCVRELETRSKQHFHRLNDHILKSETTTGEGNEPDTISLPELMGEVKELTPVKQEYDDLVHQLPEECSGVTGEPGTYLIRPGDVPVEAWCANGTTTVQRRYNGTVEFNRRFEDYERGFGDSDGEHWLGLDNMHLITGHNCSSMRIDMVDIYGGHWYAQYTHFSVASKEKGYALYVSGFKGNASDAFAYQNGMEFSAVDRDRDTSNTNCAANYEGGWWYSHCQHVNINGKYSLGLTWFDAARNEWIAVSTSEMRVYPRSGCAPPPPKLHTAN